MNSRRAVIVGGGAAGFFAAVTIAEAAPGMEVIVLERGPQFLSKVKISGGGRCNVTHACFDARELTTRYPRGERALIAPFKQFQASDTVAWFEQRGVKLKIENDGRMFPTTDSSQTIIDCLLNAARNVGIKLRMNCGAESVAKKYGGGFELKLSGGETLSCDKLLLATGRFTRPHAGTARAVVVHVSHRDAVVAHTCRSFFGNGRGVCPGNKIARARRVAHHALGFERPGDFAAVCVGRA